MSLFYSYKNTTVRIGPKPMIDYYDYLYKSNTYLKIYLTFNNIIILSSIDYIPNLAPGANNTSDTTGWLFRCYYGATLSNTTFKWGSNSLYLNLNFARNTISTYTFPQNTGLTFTIWVNITSNNNAVGPLFSFTNSSNTVSLRLNSKTAGVASNNGPWYLNYKIESASYYVDPTITKNPINQNTWNHFAWTISPAAYGALTTYIFYINGTQVASINSSSLGTIYPQNYARNTNDFGAEPGISPLVGYFDTFRFYETALTASDINAIYNYADPKNIM